MYIVKDNISIDPLWETILNMSLGERYAFRRNQPTSKPPLYVTLYDAIVANNHYDEVVLKKKLIKTLPEAKFVYNKHILLQKLCESNAIYHIQHDEEMQVLQLLQIVRMLRVKGQINLALKNLEKAYKIVNKNEYHSLFRLCLNESIRIELFNKSNSNLKGIAEVVQKSEENSIKYKDILLVQSNYLRLINYRRASNILLTTENKNEIKKIKSVFAKIIVYENASNSFLNLYYMGHATLEYLEGRYANAFESLHKNLILWQNGSLNIIGNVEFYFDLLSMYTDVAFILNKYTEVQCAIDHTCNSTLTNNYAKYNFQTIQFRCLNRMYNKKGDYEKVKELINKHEGDIQNWIQYSNAEYKMLLINSIGVSFFVLKKYNDAFYYFKQFNESFNKTTRKELQTFGYLFLTVISYELKNEMQFESSYNNAYKHFYSHNNPLLFEKVILHLLKATFKNKLAKDSKVKMENVLQELDANKNDPTQQMIFTYFNFPRWIRSKIQNKDYKELVMEELKLNK
jgi:hypothetical protein